jgi:hypothetical protein
LTFVLVVTLSLVACVAGRAPIVSPAASPVAAATPTPVASPSLVPPTVSPLPSAPPPTASPTASTAPQPSSPLPEPGELPPLAVLRTVDGAPIEAKHGSWCYGDSCADVVAGPIDLLPLLSLDGPDAQLELSLPPPYRFVYWRVRYRDAADDYLGTPEGGTRYPDPDYPVPSGLPVIVELESASFAGPPSGSWILVVQLSHAPELGDATYYWHAAVP